jgi:acyl-CoA synthetase (AMP-forming)/AMP-acid ligase II
MRAVHRRRPGWRGHLDRPALAAERFGPHPLGGGAGRRPYRTGDRVRVAGARRAGVPGARLDVQVKVRGFRIGLGEIEARPAEHPEVREAVVSGRQDAPGEKKRLVAYVPGEAPDAEAPRARLSKRLPEYRIPAAYAHLVHNQARATRRRRTGRLAGDPLPRGWRHRAPGRRPDAEPCPRRRPSGG